MSTIVSSSATGQTLLEQLSQARRETDALFSIVKPDSIYERPIAERHRIIFYIGHLEAFDWNLFHDRVLAMKSFHPEFDQLFAFGIDPVGGGLPNDQPSQWPSVAEVKDYVRNSRALLDDKLPEALDSNSFGRDGFDLTALLNVAIEHRLMHAETLAYMLHQLPLDHKIRFSERSDLRTPTESLSTDSPDNQSSMVEIPAGSVTMGLNRHTGKFGWDNEFEAHSVNVPAFSIDRYKVTNRQYLEFITAGGYETPEFWSADDWAWISERLISHPAFWKRNESSDHDKSNPWLYRTMFNDVQLPPHWPVYVSQAEARAYANWAGKSLPTEAEWHRAAHSTPEGQQRLYPWGSETPSSKFGNFDFDGWNPVPVNACPAGASAFGAQGMLGNGWEWTSTEFAPYPGFEPFPFYPGYSANFFDGKHFVMKGGSARTAACMLRSSFRNWFQAHYQFIYTGFRCVSR
jgi:ergothioneine biosynthesis protein EgtB